MSFRKRGNICHCCNKDTAFNIPWNYLGTFFTFTRNPGAPSSGSADASSNPPAGTYGDRAADGAADRGRTPEPVRPDL